MKLYFDDEQFDALLQRALGHTYYGGADVGECFATAQRIKAGDLDGWYTAWCATAERLVTVADGSRAAGHRVSAREAYLRAATYFRTAYLVLLAPPLDPRLVAAYDRQVAAFRSAAALLDTPFEALRIPYAPVSLPAYFFRVDDQPTPRPTVILLDGYDSTMEEGYHFNVVAALRRGYNCLTFDGPGQGELIFKHGVPFRPDWEAVVRPVVDHLLTRPEVDPTRLVLVGVSWGGYLAPRAAAYEHRLAALIADPGEWDTLTAIRDRIPLPPALRDRMAPSDLGRIADVSETLNALLRHPTAGWALRRTMLVHGVTTPEALFPLMRDYSLVGLAEQIRCPTLVCAAENDPISHYAPQLYAALRCPKHMLTFTAAEGAGEHCEVGARSLFHQRAFDWLNGVGAPTPVGA